MWAEIVGWDLGMRRICMSMVGRNDMLFDPRCSEGWWSRTLITSGRRTFGIVLSGRLHIFHGGLIDMGV